MRKDLKHEIMFQREVTNNIFRILSLLMPLFFRSARVPFTKSRKKKLLAWIQILLKNYKNNWKKIY